VRFGTDQHRRDADALRGHAAQERLERPR
jgi:hypothetical protein